MLESRGLEKRCLAKTHKSRDGGIMMWGFSCHILGPLIPVGLGLNATVYPPSNGCFLQDNAPFYTSSCFHQYHNNKFTALLRPPQSADLKWYFSLPQINYHLFHCIGVKDDTKMHSFNIPKTLQSFQPHFIVQSLLSCHVAAQRSFIICVSWPLKGIHIREDVETSSEREKYAESTSPLSLLLIRINLIYWELSVDTSSSDQCPDSKRKLLALLPFQTALHSRVEVVWGSLVGRKSAKFTQRQPV